MSIPVRVKVGPFWYDVETKTHIASNDGEILQGQIHNGELKIVISEAFPFIRQRETFLHELLHAISCERTLDLDEHTVDQMSSGLTQVLTDNPNILSLFEGDG